MIKNIIIIVVFLMTFYSCNRKQHQKEDKGILFEYDLKYLVAPAENPIINLLPEKMYLYYKDHHFLYYTEGWMGLFSISQIINIDDSTRIVMAKFLDKKYAYQHKIYDDALKYEIFEDFFLSEEERDTTFLYYGGKCYNISAAGIEENSELIYTNDFDMPNPNLFLPYHFIEGLLLKFPMNTFGIPTQVELISYTDTLLNDSVFIRPNEYILLDRREFEEIFDQYTPQ